MESLGKTEFCGLNILGFTILALCSRRRIQAPSVYISVVRSGREELCLSAYPDPRAIELCLQPGRLEPLLADFRYRFT